MSEERIGDNLVFASGTGEVYVEPPFLRTAYNYDRNSASVASGLECLDPSLTVQSQAEEADINVIVKRFGITGEVPVSARMPSYQDFAEVFDYRTAVETVMAAEEAFMQVPADIRARFHNDPGAFAEFCENPHNLPELRKMGLAKMVEPTNGSGNVVKDGVDSSGSGNAGASNANATGTSAESS